MNRKIVIPGELPSLNKYIDKERSNKFAGATLKRKATAFCAMYFKAAIAQQKKKATNT